MITTDILLQAKFLDLNMEFKYTIHNPGRSEFQLLLPTWFFFPVWFSHLKEQLSP